MTTSTLVDLARSIATKAHEHQIDKSGQPYIGHPVRVAERVRGDDAAEVVAWLHDVVEDTNVTLDDLRAHFSDVIVDAVDAMSKRNAEPIDDYYARVMANPVARAVKLADIADNTDPRRSVLLDERTRTRLAAKYAHARVALCATL